MGILRILLAVCVFCAHSRQLGDLPWLAGNMAVELFYVVSGFYMQLVLSTRYTKEKLGNDWKYKFYEARYFRLLPIYLGGGLLIVGTALLSPSLNPFPSWNPLPSWSYDWELPNTIGNLLFKAFICLTNFTIFFQDITYFLSVHGGQIYLSGNYHDSDVPLWSSLIRPQGWSLGIELSFYLVAPYLLNLRSRGLIVCICCSLTIKAIAYKALGLMDPWTYQFFPFEIGYFLLGALAFRYRSSLDGLVPQRIGIYLVYPLALCFTAFTARIHLFYVGYPLALACSLPFMFRMTAGIKIDRLIGELSYPFSYFTYLDLRSHTLW